MRQQEKGRYVIVKQTESGVRKEISMTEHNARTRVHEYGGGPISSPNRASCLRISMISVCIDKPPVNVDQYPQRPIVFMPTWSMLRQFVHLFVYGKIIVMMAPRLKI